MTLPAVVTILDLATAVAASTGMWLEASFTTGGVATTNRVSLQQIMSTNLGALPTGGATGQLLTKSSGSDFATQWSSISSLVTVNATSGLQLAGSTTIALALASVAGLSVLGTNTTGTTIPLPVTASTGAQALRMNDAGTGFAWGAINLASAAAVTGVLRVPTGGSGTATLTAFGVLFGNGTSAIGVTAAGTTGWPLIGQGTAVAASFTTIGVIGGGVGIANYTIGDILYASATTTLSKLAAGTTGYLLQTRGTSTSPQWVGGMVLLNTLSPNNVATVGDTASLTNLYRSYLIEFDNIVPATNNVLFFMQVATSGASFIAANYVGWNIATIGGTTVSVAGASTVLLLTGASATTSLGNGTTYGLNGFIKIYNPAGTTSRKMVVGEVTYLNGTTSATTNYGYAVPQGYWDGGNNAITGIQFLMSSGNIQTGTIKIYGMS